MTEYEEVCIDKTITELEVELQYQYDLGYNAGDSFPAYIIDRIQMLKNKDMEDKIVVKVINKSDNDLPKYETIGSVGMDIRANIELQGSPDNSRNGVLIYPNTRTLIKTGLFVAIPVGYEIQVRARSGLAYKQGMMVVNGVGTIDSDYRGEIGVILYNSSDKIVTINHSDRIAQLVLKKAPQLEWDLVDELPTSDRGEGGFGSTGGN